MGEWLLMGFRIAAALSLFFFHAAALSQFGGIAFWQQPNELKLLAGNFGSYGNIDGPAAGARFYYPTQIAIHSSGNMYVTDTLNHTIRKIAPTGAVTTLAGKAGFSGSTDGTGASARFNDPEGIAVDSAGDVYVADIDNHTIRKITAVGVVSTFAGTAGASGSTDGTGAAARFNFPTSLAVDSADNVYVADLVNHTIRKITPGGVVTTLAGTAGSSGSTNGNGAAARFAFPTGLAVDSSGNVYVSDRNNHTIRQITSAGDVTTLAGTPGASGSTDGTGAAARFYNPREVAVDSSGNVYVADLYNHTIRKIAPGGVVTTFAGTALATGSVDGTGAAARFNYPRGVAVTPSGDIYVVDHWNHVVRKITPGGVVTTFAGTAESTSSVDGTGAAASFKGISDVVVDSSSNVYVADVSHTIRKITSGGVVTTFAGAAGVSGSTDATGGAARFYYPSGLAFDSSGNLYVADSSNNTIRKITSGGVVTTFAGTAGSSGSANGNGAAARFNTPTSVAVDTSGNVYVADSWNYTVRKITSAGDVTTLAGTAGSWGSANGTGAVARFNRPNGIAVDSSGNVYVTDIENHTIRKITSGGDVTTFAGTAGSSGSANGAGASARFRFPSGITVDSSNNFYVTDMGNSTIRKITPGGVVSTQVGSSPKIGVALGSLPSSAFSPEGISTLNNIIYFGSAQSVLYFQSP